LEQNSSVIHEENSRSYQLEQEPSLIRPKTSRGRVPTPPFPTEKKSIEEDRSENIYQEIGFSSIDNNQLKTPNTDLEFIRGAIDRVFHFNGESTTDTTSESSTYYEEVDDNNLNPSKKTSKQYPAVEAVQRFYNHKTLTDFIKEIPIGPITNLDDAVISNSSISKKSRTRSPIITARKKHSSKSFEHERTSSEEIDDTLNDIEDVDSHDEKFKRQLIHHHSTHTSNENSPLNSLDIQSKTKKTSSQEIQTIERVCH